uniref:Uncharacterized protein n=1 Tax=Brassica campestris TaxID=3711 RepID=A0A3P5Z8L7_BRACM|nr:unnamed protein product [Brassica rapa]
MRRKRANLKLRESGVGRKHKRPHREEQDPNSYAKLPIRQVLAVSLYLKLLFQLSFLSLNSRSQLSETSAAFAKNTFGLNLKPENESVYEIEGDNDDQIMEELPCEDKLSRTGKRHGSLDGSGLDFSQRGEGSPLKKNLVSNLHLQFGKQSISGPLIFKSGKIDEILQRNESNIRQAVRKSHIKMGK